MLSAALMLDHLGEPAAAAELDAAVDAVLAAGGAGDDRRVGDCPFAGSCGGAR